MVRDQGEIVMVLAPGDLIHAQVHQVIRMKAQTLVLSVRVTSQTTRSSKSPVNREPWWAKGTAWTTTPWVGQCQG
ncbi:hypothetical protein GCM10023166_27290 [Paeniglutamicibacter cryotolerans]